VNSGHYENFPVASLLLPRPQRGAIAAIYAFARGADDFADEPQYEGRRLGLLKGWQSRLERPGEDPAFLALHDSIRRYAIPKQHFKDLIAAFSQDCRVRRYANFGSLLAYCSQSANPVGRLVLRVFGVDSAEAALESDAICTALQLTNFWQDLASDAQIRDRVYLPMDEMRRFGVRAQELKEGRFSHRLRELLRFQVNRTESYFARGEGLCSRLKGRLGLELRLTLLGGRRVLEKIRAQGYDTLSARPKLKLPDFGLLLGRLALGKLG
jgi:phytoene synthase